MILITGELAGSSLEGGGREKGKMRKLPGKLLDQENMYERGTVTFASSGGSYEILSNTSKSYGNDSITVKGVLSGISLDDEMLIQDDDGWVWPYLSGYGGYQYGLEPGPFPIAPVSEEFYQQLTQFTKQAFIEVVSAGIRNKNVNVPFRHHSSPSEIEGLSKSDLKDVESAWSTRLVWSHENEVDGDLDP